MKHFKNHVINKKMIENKSKFLLFLDCVSKILGLNKTKLTMTINLYLIVTINLKRHRTYMSIEKS